MEQETDQNILQHLLHLEGEASSLVDDAQAEANRRLAEAEKQCRIQFDESYSVEAEKLEIIHKNEIDAIRKDYRKQLESYRAELLAQSVDKKAFTDLAAGLFLGRK